MHRISAGALLRLATLAADAFAGDPEEILAILRDAQPDESSMPNVDAGPDLGGDKPAKPE